MKRDIWQGTKRAFLGLLVFVLLLLGNFDQGSSKGTPLETWDDRLLQIETSVPGFGGMYTAQDGQLVAYLLDPSKVGAVEKTIRTVFGPSFIPDAGIRAIRGNYTVSQLKRWTERANQLLKTPGVVLVDLDEGRNRVMIGVDANSRFGSVEKSLDGLQIPREAVVVAVNEKIFQLGPGDKPGSRADRQRK